MTTLSTIGSIKILIYVFTGHGDPTTIRHHHTLSREGSILNTTALWALLAISALASYGHLT